MTDAFNPYEKFVILVVEDEPHTRGIIKGMLRQIGVRSVVEAAEGRAGLDEVMRAKPHLVFCDIHMQPVDGRTFLKLLRQAKLEHIRRTPVVFLTADAQRDTVMFAKEHHIDGYLVKPVSLGDLKSRIDAILKPAPA
ncbi:MAG: response regulator [Proteobacteria bacterium]|nr:response regulator [Pseudomonadota bacterium]MBI3500101.1 response regulator [Pseudomonadota bacterium]